MGGKFFRATCDLFSVVSHVGYCRRHCQPLQRDRYELNEGKNTHKHSFVRNIFFKINHESTFANHRKLGYISIFPLRKTSRTEPFQHAGWWNPSWKPNDFRFTLLSLLFLIDQRSHVWSKTTPGRLVKLCLWFFLPTDISSWRFLDAFVLLLFVLGWYFSDFSFLFEHFLGVTSETSPNETSSKSSSLPSLCGLMKSSPNQ